MPTTERTPALCKLLEYDGDEAVCFVNTGTNLLPRVGFPAAELRAAYLEPGQEFVWFTGEPRKDPPIKISTDAHIIALAKGRIELMGMQSEEDREEAKWKAVPDSVVQQGADLFKAFHLASDNRPMFDEKYFRTFDAMCKLLEPFDLLSKYRDVLLDRMIVRGREACAERMKKLCAKQTSVPVYPDPFTGKFEVKCDPPVTIGEPVPSYSDQWAKLSRWQRIKFRVKLAWRVLFAWRALFASLPPKQTKKEEHLELACHYMLAQEFDDICWLDFYLKIAKILGVDYDPKLLPRDRFLGNCGRFYDSMAAGKPYQRDPSKECPSADGTVQSGCGDQPRHPLPVHDRREGCG